jgi:hypothetical protein
MKGGATAELAGAAPINCARHSDNVGSAVRLFTELPEPEERKKIMRTCVPKVSFALILLAALFWCGTCGCEELSRRARSITVTNPDGTKTRVMQREMDPSKTGLVETVGGLFGPIGEAVAKCGIAIVALALAESNRRQMKKHLKETHGK